MGNISLDTEVLCKLFILDKKKIVLEFFNQVIHKPIYLLGDVAYILVDIPTRGCSIHVC